MLTVILIIAAAIVFYIAHTKFHQKLKNKDLSENILPNVVNSGHSESSPEPEAVVDPPESEIVVEPVESEVVVETASAAKSVRAQTRARNKGKFQADNPETDKNEAYKEGRKPRVRVKKNNS